MTDQLQQQPIYYAWHGDQALRDATIAKLHDHRTQDQFIQGAYSQGSGDDWKGCWYGCLTGEPIDVHQVAYDKFGIHPCVGSLIEQCYEHLPANVAVDTVLNLTESIPVGADLRVIYSRWVCDWLTPRLHVMAVADQQVLAAIEGVTGIFANDAWPAYDAARAASDAAADAAAYAADAATGAATGAAVAAASDAARAAVYAARAATGAATGAAVAAASDAARAAVYAARAAREAAYAACAARAASDAAADAAAYAAADAALEVAYAARAAADAAARAATDAAARAATDAAADAATWQSLADWLLAEMPKCPCPVIDAEEIL